MSFVHLHVHTGYSLLDSMIRIPDLVKKVAGDGQPACGLTDHGTLAGVVKFTDQCNKVGVKPILGMETYIAPDSRLRKSYPKGAHSYSHLILFAKNEEGWHNLKRLSTLAYTEGFYRKPRIDRALLKEHSAGLICSSACIGGDIAIYLKGGMDADGEGKIEADFDFAAASIAWYFDLFGDDFYLEIQAHDEAHARIAQWYRERYPAQQIIPTADAHYLEHEHHDIHDTLLCCGTYASKDDPNRFRFGSDQNWLKTTAEMAALFPANEIANTVALAEKVDFVLPLRKQFFMPELPADITDGGVTAPEDVFRRECVAGLANRLDADLSLAAARYDDTVLSNAILAQGWFADDCAAEYRDRLEYEMDVFIKAGFVEYALLLWDLMAWCQAMSIFTGDGRGSGAGSLVLYALGITNVDPILRKCPFERFINAGRLEKFAPPDVDLDFPRSRREDVIDYLRQRYGQDNVCRIGTYATLGAPATLKRLQKPLGLDYGLVMKLAAMLPAGEAAMQGKGPAGEALGYSLDDAYLQIDGFRKGIDAMGEAGQWLMFYARHLRELGANTSTHASGVIITDRPVLELVPLMNQAGEGDLMAQVDMFDSEALGVIKFDILGLILLDVLAYVDRMIRENDDPDFSFHKIDLDDPAAYKLLHEGRTAGIFQASGGGFGRLLPQALPQSVEDLAVLTSLCRPGPMQAGATEAYLRRRRGQEEITYHTKELAPILGANQGVIVFQEDVMAIANQLAGYTLAEADDLRKAMGKKQTDKIGEMRPKFLEGCVNNGIALEAAEKIWAEMEKMATYVFNRSHAMAYSYLTAKCLAGDTIIPLLDGTNPTIRELSQRKESFWVYSCDGEKIVPGLAHDARSTGTKPVVEVVLDNGEVVRCTRDHRMMLRFGDWKEAGDLVPGDRLMPFYRKMKKNYEQVYHPGLDLWEPTHRTVARDQHRESFFNTKTRHIDHINDDQSDNRPENLQCLTKADHQRKTQRDNWQLRREKCVAGIRERCRTPEAREKFSAARKRWWDSKSPEQREAIRKKNSESHKGKGWSEKRRIAHALNHRVVEVRSAGETEVFDLTVEKHHNFAIGQGVIVHNCAWSKAHFPAYFLAGSLSAENQQTGKDIPALLQDARYLGVSICLPDINESQEEYHATDRKTIRVGLLGVKGVGEKAVRAILAERSSRGPFASKDDFRARLEKKTVNSKVLQALEDAGAFDALEGRKRLLTTERCFEEFELFGAFLSGHPCERLRPAWQAENEHLVTLASIEAEFRRERVRIHTRAGSKVVWAFQERQTRAIVTKIDRKKSKDGSNRVTTFLDVEDETASLRVMLGSKQLEKFGNPTITKGAVLNLRGRKGRETGYLDPTHLEVLGSGL